MRPRRVLEIGCGRGAGARLLLEEFRPATLHAFDLDYRMIRLARKYLRGEPRDRIGLYVGDAQRLPYRDGVLDAVFGFGVLHHVPDWRGSLKEIARVLKPGGVTAWRSFTPSSIRTFWPGESFCTRNTTVLAAMTCMRPWPRRASG